MQLLVLALALAGVSVICYTDAVPMYNAAMALDAAAISTLFCAILANVGDGAPPKKGEAGYMKWMIGVHLGLLLPPVFVLCAVLVSVLGLEDLSTPRRASTMWLVSIASLVALAYIIRLRPRKAGGDAGMV